MNLLPTLVCVTPNEMVYSAGCSPCGPCSPCSPCNPECGGCQPDPCKPAHNPCDPNRPGY